MMGDLLTAGRSVFDTGRRSVTHKQNDSRAGKHYQRDDLRGCNGAESIAIEPHKVEEKADRRVRHQVNKEQISVTDTVAETAFKKNQHHKCGQIPERFIQKQRLECLKMLIARDA